MPKFEGMPLMEAAEAEKEPYTAEELKFIERDIKSTSGFFSEARKAEKIVNDYKDPAEALETIAHGLKPMCDLEDFDRLDADRIPEGEEKAKELVADAAARLAKIRAGRDAVIARNPVVYQELMGGLVGGLERDINAREKGTSATAEEAIEGRIQELRTLGNKEYLSQAIAKLESIRATIKDILPNEGADAVGRLDLKIETLRKALEKMD